MNTQSLPSVFYLYNKIYIYHTIYYIGLLYSTYYLYCFVFKFSSYLFWIQHYINVSYLHYERMIINFANHMVSENVNFPLGPHVYGIYNNMLWSIIYRWCVQLFDVSHRSRIILYDNIILKKLLYQTSSNSWCWLII